MSEKEIKNTMCELTEAEEKSIDGGKHLSASYGNVRYVKRNTTIYQYPYNKNSWNLYVDIKKGTKVTIITFSDSTGVKLDNKPATLIKYNGQKYYIKASDISGTVNGFIAGERN